MNCPNCSHELGDLAAQIRSENARKAAVARHDRIRAGIGRERFHADLEKAGAARKPRKKSDSDPRK